MRDISHGSFHGEEAKKKAYSRGRSDSDAEGPWWKTSCIRNDGKLVEQPVKESLTPSNAGAAWTLSFEYSLFGTYEQNRRTIRKGTSVLGGKKNTS